MTNMNKLELNKSELQNALNQKSGSLISESAAIVYSLNTYRIKSKASVFGFISARSGEGTTYSAVAVLEALPKLLGDVSAVLVDANLSHTDLSYQVGFPKKGWANWLANEASYDIEDVVITWKNTAGLGVLPVGVNSNFVDKKYIAKFVDVIALLKTSFDFILLDCQPFFSDKLSSQFCLGSDKVVIVIEAEKTRKFLVRIMMEELQEMKIDTLGSILNKRRYHIPQWLYKHLF